MTIEYQIFVSLTYEDLKDERREHIKACLNMGHIPVGKRPSKRPMAIERWPMG